MKADRRASALIVHAAYVESGFNPREVATSLATELRRMAAWLSLESVRVGPKGTLATALERALGSRR